ncbi:leucine-rich repeat-containing protein 51-like [Metopolophium dirhodum]|uniref:leucine-rich repeat-containing protein 51-like n=1 Tax=Metopolophium dirhodum TaxID=44670 RepID=UPI00298F52C4|nr:leucine-rich repeat-containing protein 51-like [Metopolophium dirhodum]
MSQDDESKCNTAYQYFKCAKPLDFSYRNLVSLEELNGNEEPLPLRVGGAPKKNLKSNRYKTGSFWLNKNNLKNVNGLRNLADRLFEMADYLSWLDLSDNNLTSISDEFLLFPNLSMLYLHKNNIQDFVDSYKLRKLDKLRTLTLHKNPMCGLPCYRSTVISFLPNLRKLDHVVVVRSEREQDRKSFDKNVRERLTNAYPEDFLCTIESTKRPS